MIGVEVWAALAGAGALCSLLQGAKIRDLTNVAARQRHELSTDSLTGLASRKGLTDGWGKHAHSNPAVIVIDLDGFKAVNDQHGHKVGDLVLAHVASRLNSLPGVLVAARLGGDEFALVVDLADHRTAFAFATDLATAIRQPITVYAQTVTVGASVGVALAPALLHDGLGRADRAMYRAKRAGDLVAVYDLGVDGPYESSVVGPRPRTRARDAVRATS